MTSSLSAVDEKIVEKVTELARHAADQSENEVATVAKINEIEDVKSVSLCPNGRTGSFTFLILINISGGRNRTAHITKKFK